MRERGVKRKIGIEKIKSWQGKTVGCGERRYVEKRSGETIKRGRAPAGRAIGCIFCLSRIGLAAKGCRLCPSRGGRRAYILDTFLFEERSIFAVVGVPDGISGATPTTFLSLALFQARDCGKYERTKQSQKRSTGFLTVVDVGRWQRT